MRAHAARLLIESSGQDLIEYALLASLIALTAMAGVTALGSALSAAWNSLAGAVGAIP